MAANSNVQRTPFVKWSVQLTRLFRHGDLVFRGLTVLASSLVLLVTVAIGYELWQNSALPLDKFGLQFLTSVDWDPVNQTFGALPFIYGTLQTSFLALILAVPIGLGIAIFLAELAPDWLRQPLGFLVELLAAVPSVVYGLWGLYVFIPALVKPTAQFLNAGFSFLPFFEGPVLVPADSPRR